MRVHVRESMCYASVFRCISALEQGVCWFCNISYSTRLLSTIFLIAPFIAMISIASEGGPDMLMKVSPSTYLTWIPPVVSLILALLPLQSSYMSSQIN